jgi:hypothetical protein
MKIDNRLFKYAGTSHESDGTVKTRFANDSDNRPKILEKLGNTNLVLIALPEPMTKSDAILYLQKTQPEGVSQTALVAKASYIKAQYEKLTSPPRKRGRPAKVKTPLTETSVDSIVNTIVNKVRSHESTK